jgi:hypothetical protein
VIYRGDHHAADEGVCIYLDGLSNHIHGNPETAARDQKIREWLKNNDYDAIEIAANELDDQDAMVRYFRKLAAYLRADRLRRALRDDVTWHERGLELSAEPAGVPYRIVEPRLEDRFNTCVPLYSLQAAAGAFSDAHDLIEGPSEWVEVETRHRLRDGMFVAQVVGKSMEPTIPDGSFCLFDRGVAGSRQGKIVLVELRGDIDPETGHRYTVKR